MSLGEAKCRKCRSAIINGEHVLTLQDYVEDGEGEQPHKCQENVWFIPFDVISDSIRATIEQSGYTKGKIVCHQCGSKLGGFDFVSGTRCECACVVLPPVWLHRNRVDIAMALPPHIEARLQEFRQQSPPEVDSFPDTLREPITEPIYEASYRPYHEPIHVHDDHMFDTTCEQCRHEFVMSERNYEFRGPVSHGDHVFDTSCDICRAVFLADHIEHEFGFQSSSDLAMDTVTDTIHEVENTNTAEETVTTDNTPQSEATTNCDDAGDGTAQAPRENDLTEGNAEASTERGGGDADNDTTDAATWNNPFNELALPEEQEQAEEKKEEQAEAAAESEEAGGGAGVEESGLVCPVCLELLYLPHWCSPCEHVFCAPCLRRLRAMSPAAATPCPLCRNTITKCLPQHDMCRTIKAKYPEEHRKRRQMEKRNRRHPTLPLPGAPAPGSLSSFLAQRHVHRNNNRAGGAGGGGGSQVLAAGAGVCFVVLLMMLGFTVFATTVGFVLWYLVEVSMDVLCDLAAEASTLLELGYQAIVVACIEGRVPTDLARLASASAARMIGAFTKLVNRTRGADTDASTSSSASSPDLPEASDAIPIADIMNGTAPGTQFLSRMAQAQMANYVLVGFLVTYLLYRFAKHVQQARRVDA